MAEPRQPDAPKRERLLAVLGELIATGGATPLLRAPVEPGKAAFPEPWAATKPGIVLLLRRLLWYAGITREIEVDDQRPAKPPISERRLQTNVSFADVTAERSDSESGQPGSMTRGRARFTLGLIGEDDIAGTLAHEVGVLYAAMHRQAKTDPYRSAVPPLITVDPDHDLERGAVATIYLGLGVLAANAAYQQYSGNGRFNGGWVPLVYDVKKAGALPMSSLAYLLAVQAVIRGELAPPDGLAGPQRDEVSDWIRVLADQRTELRAQLGIAAGETVKPRADVVAFTDQLPSDEPPRPVAFRWLTHRGGVGFVAGTVLGMGLAFAVSRGLLPITMVGGGTAGHVIGRRVRAPRCSSCATLLPANAVTCPHCGAVLRGDIASLGERLEAEERLEEDSRESA